MAELRLGGVDVIVFGVLLLAVVTVSFLATRWRRPRTTLQDLEEWGVGEAPRTDNDT